jgi:acetylornithine/LysW-gamma-L-lysine aminotransferase
MTSNFGVSLFGYSNQNIKNKLISQIENLSTLHASFNNNVRSEALKALTRILRNSGFDNLNRFYFSNSGAEAVEAAIKFAILASGKNKFLSPRNDYHGKTIGALAATTSADGKYQKPFKDILLEVTNIEFGNIKDLEDKITDDYAALILEPIQGEGGVIIPTEEYLIEVSKLCKKKEIILIVDEIQTGAGRTGTFLNIEKIKDFHCDIVCLGKGIAGGIPVGITAISDEINDKIPKGIQTSTFGGNPLAMAGILASLEELKNSNILENTKIVGKYFIESLKNIANKEIVEVRGDGLIIGLEMKTDAIELIKFLQQNKVLATPSSGNTIRFLPPLIITKNDVDLVTNLIEKFLRNV